MTKPTIAAKKSKMIDMKAGEYWWCSCGKSENQPFCDGSHQGTDFDPMQVKIDNDRTVFWCQCKMSNTKPFCDGTHKKL